MDNNTKKYPEEEEKSNLFIASEPAAALAEQETFVLPDVEYADIVEGILQVTPDIEEEIVAAERGDTVQLDEFKTMFAKWLD